jgi:hypothetical protein
MSPTGDLSFPVLDEHLQRIWELVALRSLPKDSNGVLPGPLLMNWNSERLQFLEAVSDTAYWRYINWYGNGGKEIESDEYEPAGSESSDGD